MFHMLQSSSDLLHSHMFKNTASHKILFLTTTSTTTCHGHCMDCSGSSKDSENHWELPQIVIARHLSSLFDARTHTCLWGISRNALYPRLELLSCRFRSAFVYVSHTSAFPCFFSPKNNNEQIRIHGFLLVHFLSLLFVFRLVNHPFCVGSHCVLLCVSLLSASLATFRFFLLFMRIAFDLSSIPLYVLMNAHK
jgi:hypothetical protein